MAQVKTQFVYIVSELYSERDANRLGILKLIKLRYNVVVWDITKVINKSNNLEIIDRRKECIQINNRQELLSCIGGLSCQHVVIPFFSIDSKNIWIFKAINKNNLRYVVINTNIIPEAKLSFIQRLFNIAKNTDLSTSSGMIFNYVLKSIPLKYLGISQPSFYLTGGKVGISYASGRISKSTRVINAHSMDYEIYMDMEKSSYCENKSLKKYIVFIDQYWPDHTDIKYKFLNKGEYTKQLDRIFCHLETKYNLPVIIAGHPRRPVESTDFYSREIVLCSTPQLIKNSELVISHYSTSLSFAALYHKPILFLNHSKLPSYYLHTITLFANLLSQPMIYMNEFSSVKIDPNIWEPAVDHYSNYIENYVKTDMSDTKSMYEILADYITNG